MAVHATVSSAMGCAERVAAARRSSSASEHAASSTPCSAPAS